MTLRPPSLSLSLSQVLVRIDGVELAQDGTVPLRTNERIHFM